MGFGSKTFEQLKAEYPTYAYLPLHCRMKINSQLRDLLMLTSVLPSNSDPLSPSEYYQNLQRSCMDFAKLAIEHYNKHNDNKSEEFKAVTVESMDFTRGVIQADVTLDKDRKTEVVYCSRI